jgi:hypothetical protein
VANTGWPIAAQQAMRKVGRETDGHLKVGNFADSVKMWPSTSAGRCAGVTNFTRSMLKFKIVTRNNEPAQDLENLNSESGLSTTRGRQATSWRHFHA